MDTKNRSLSDEDYGLGPIVLVASCGCVLEWGFWVVARCECDRLWVWAFNPRGGDLYLIEVDEEGQDEPD